MEAILQPNIVTCQQLKVVQEESNIFRMANNNEKILFSNRLHELCEEKNLPEDGRQQVLKAICKTTQQAVSKWFLGEAVPKHENKIALCEYFNVKYEWLATGLHKTFLRQYYQ